MKETINNADIRIISELEETKVSQKTDHADELADFLASEYGFRVNAIFPAERGFYGETWKIQTEDGVYFVKIDYRDYHKESYRSSLSAVQYMTGNGISFIPKVIKTKGGCLYTCFKKGVAAVFEYVDGELSENCPVEQLYGCLAKVYRLKAYGMSLETENFGVEIIDTFYQLRNMPELPAAVSEALDRKEAVISEYAKRMKQFSAACKSDRNNFCITHGDAGGNCIINGSQLFLVDWDTVRFAPVERDAWVFICDGKAIAKIRSILSDNGVHCTLEQKRLCYYCYYFFFYYLDEYLKSILNTENEEEKAAVSKNLVEYLTDGWIYERLHTADLI